MTRWATTILLTMTMFSFTGCSMCSGPYDFDYPTYGGIHSRSDPSFGRLGSTFSDPNWAGGGPSADSNLNPHPEGQGELDFGLDDDEPLEGDDDFERADEDLDDDLEGLDDDLEELNQRLEELSKPRKGSQRELESIKPLEDVNLLRGSGNQARADQRRRGLLPRRRGSLPRRRGVRLR